MTHRVFPDWRDAAAYSAAGPTPTVLAEADRLKVILGGLEPGQRIPVHPEGLASYCFLDGTGWMTVDGERFAVRPGTIVVTPDGAKRGVEAETRLSFLASRAG